MKFSLSTVAGLLSLISLSIAANIPETLDIRSLLQPLTNRDVVQNTADYYLGYRGTDYDHSWSKYFNDTTVELNDDFTDGLARSPVAPTLGIPIEQAGAALNQPSYLQLENGYTIMDDGTMYLAIQSFVPSEFTGEQYDFWFSWHVNDTTKYKIWNPAQHQYAAVEPDQLAGAASKASYRARYWDLTSYVDKYIASMPYKISIGFFDPSLTGFVADNPSTGVETIVTAFVQIFLYSDLDPAQMAEQGFGPIDVVLAHQVRARPDGSGKEIWSRFRFGGGVVTAMRLIMDPLDLAHDLSLHCATEMTHMGTLLPALFEEFKDDTATASYW